MTSETISREDFEKAHEQCETEPFLTPASIQPHGLLIAFEADSLRIRQLSANAAAWFGRPAEALLDASLSTLLPAQALATLREALEDPGSGFFPLSLHQPCHGVLYHSDGLAVLEIEPQLLAPDEVLSLHRKHRQITRRLQNTTSMAAMGTAVAMELRHLLQVDQVVVYRFGLDGHGRVVAESRNASMPSYLDQHFPASDVPRQVRRHAAIHRTRFTPDIHATGLPLVPALNPLTRRPLDQAPSRLRSPHFWAVQYYRNMGVRGMLALSVVDDDRLWGYICVHHRQPRALDRELVEMTETITQTFAALIRPREIHDYQAFHDKLQTLLDQVLYSVSRAEPWWAGFFQTTGVVLELMQAGGFAIWVDSEHQQVGDTPDTIQLSGLVDWLNHRGEVLFCTSDLGSHYPPACGFRDRGAGLLALSVSEPCQNWLLWFRPEVAQTVAWAGKPAKLVKPGADGQPVLTPRDSFDRWVEKVEGQSLPFRDIEIELAQELRGALLRRLLRVSRDLRNNAEQRLGEVRERLNNLLGSLQDIIWQAEAPGLQMRYISPPVELITGYPPRAFLEKPSLWLTMIHPEDRERVRAAFETSRHDELFQVEYRVIRTDGKIGWLQNRGRIFHDARSHRYRLEGIATEITNQKLMERQLYQQANYDLLTGLPNRYLALDRLTQLCARRQRDSHSPFALLYLDVNRFKLINDSLGHEAGDQALMYFARQLERCLRASDTVGRLGGDEFIVLLPDVSDVAEAVACARRIEAAIRAPLQVGEQSLQLATSIGILMVDEPELHPDRLLHRADTAMFAAKSARQLYRVFDASLDNDAQRELQLLNDLHTGLAQEQFRLYYQPVVTLPAGELLGFEALVRWQHPVRGLLLPGEFLSIVENSPLFNELGLQLLDQAIRQLMQWNATREVPLSVNVNFSATQMLAPGFPDAVARILGNHHCPPGWLKVEITETDLLSDVVQALICLERLRALGVQVLIDDFGTGYSSLSYLHRFPVAGLKIDRAFVHQLDAHNRDHTIVHSILLMASGLGLEVVAEGIESQSVAVLLAELGCRHGQGFLFDPPLDAGAASRRVLGNQS